MVRQRLLWSWLGALIPIASATTLKPALRFDVANAHAQFSPEGRKRTRGSDERRSPSRATSPAPAAGARGGNRESTVASRAPSSPAFPEGLYESLLDSPGPSLVLSKLIDVARESDPELSELTRRLERELEADQGRAYSAMMALGRLALARGNRELAREWFERAQRRAPERIHAHLALAELGSETDSLTILEAALEQVKGTDRDVLLERLRLAAVESGARDRALRYQAELTRRQPARSAELGDLYLSRGETEDAIAAFERALDEPSAASSSASLWLGLARAHRAAGQLEKAARDLEQVRSQSPRNSVLGEEATLLGIEVAEAQGTLAAHAKKFESSGNVPLLMKLSAALESSGELEQAFHFDELALRHAPRDVHVRRAQAERLERASRLAEARNSYRALLALFPQDVKAWLRVFEITSALGDSERQEEDFARALARVSPEEKLTIVDRCFTALSASVCEQFERKLVSETRDRAILFELGSRLYLAGNRSAGREAWMKARGANPDAETWSLYADQLLDHELTEEGLAAHERARARAPFDAKVRRARALALERSLSNASKGQEEDRRRLATAAWLELLSDPNVKGRSREEAARHVVRLWRRSGFLEAECERLRRIYDADPSDRVHADILVEGLLLLGRRDEAKEVLENLARLAPFDGNLRARLVRGFGSTSAEPAELGGDVLLATERAALEQKLRDRAQRELGQRQGEQALKTLERLRELRPRDAGILLLEADALGRLGRRASAAQKLQEAVRLEPRRPAVLLKQADFLLAEGRTREAAHSYMNVVRNSPTPDELAEASDALMLLRAKAGAEGPFILLSIEEGALRAFASRPGHPGYRALLLGLYDAMFLTPEVSSSSEPMAKNLARATERARMPLLTVLQDGTDSERAHAARLLARIGGSEAARSLLDYALSGASDDDVCRLLERVGDHGDDATVRSMAEALQARDTLAPRVQLWLGFALAKSPNATAVTPLLALVRQKSADLQLVGWLGLLGRTLDRRALPQEEPLTESVKAARMLTIGPDSGSNGVLHESSALRAARLISHFLHSRESSPWFQASTIRKAMVEAITDPDPLLQAAGMRALSLASGVDFGESLPDSLCGRADDLEQWVYELLTRKGPVEPSNWLFLRAELEKALLARLDGSVAERERAIAFLAQRDIPEDQRAPEELLRELRLALMPAIEEVFIHGKPKVRKHALGLLPFPSPDKREVRRVLREMLSTATTEESIAAFTFVLEHGDSASVDWLVQTWSRSRSWASLKAMVEALRKKESLAPALRELLERAERERPGLFSLELPSSPGH